MKIAKLNDMVRGWLVGNFEPSLYKTTSVEVGVKKYCAGEQEKWHFHKIATEITVIVTGRVKMNGKEYVAGDIVIIEPGEGTDFEVLENSITTVIKLPGVNNDKYVKGE
jgi:quercetin dioxygenase-like cupin family protein